MGDRILSYSVVDLFCEFNRGWSRKVIVGLKDGILGVEGVSFLADLFIVFG